MYRDRVWGRIWSWIIGSRSDLILISILNWIYSLLPWLIPFSWLHNQLSFKQKREVEKCNIVTLESFPTLPFSSVDEQMKHWWRIWENQPQRSCKRLVSTVQQLCEFRFCLYINLMVMRFLLFYRFSQTLTTLYINNMILLKYKSKLVHCLEFYLIVYKLVECGTQAITEHDICNFLPLFCSMNCHIRLDVRFSFNIWPQ